MNEKTFADNFFFYLDVFLSHFFSLLSAFLSSKPFRKNYTHCEVTDATFVDIQLQKENLKNIFLGARIWAPKLVYQSPKRPGYVIVLEVNRFLYR